MNNNLLALLKSIVITIIISSTAGGIARFTGHSFGLWFITVFLAQFVGFYLFNTYIEYKAARDKRIFQLKEAEIIAQNTMKVECASCHKENEVLIRTSEENRFICGFCNVKNSVYLTAETAIVTEPMYEPAPIPNTTSTNGL